MGKNKKGTKKQGDAKGKPKNKISETPKMEKEDSEEELNSEIMEEELSEEQEEHSDIELEEKDEDVEGDQNDGQIEEPTEEQEKMQMAGLVELAKSKKPETSKKEKERKIIDFKFRVVELLEIFLHKSKSPEIFLSAIVPLVKVMKETLKERTQSNYIAKLSLLMKKFFTKNLHFQEEVLTNLDECLNQIIFVLAKTRQKSFCQTLNGVALALIKVRVKTKGDEESKEFIFNIIKTAFEKQMKKRDVYYSDELFKEFFKLNESFLSKFIPLLIQNAKIKQEEGAKDDFNRGRALELLKVCLRTKVNGFNAYLDLVQNHMKLFSNMIKSTFSSQEDLKKSKISFFNKITDILFEVKQNISKFEENREDNEKKFNKLCESLKEVTSTWNENDQKLKGVKERLLQKLHLK